MENTIKKRSFTDKFVEAIGRIAEPLGRFTQKPAVQALQAGTSSVLPVVIVGSIFLLVAMIIDGSMGNAPITGLVPYATKLYMGYSLCNGFIGLYVALATGAHYGKRLGLPETSTIVLVAASFLAMSFGDLYGNFTTEPFGTTGMFTGIIVGLLAPRMFKWFLDKKITIKLPEMVPPNISDAFTSLIPYLVIIPLFYIVRVWLGFDLNNVVKNLVMPLFSMGENWFTFCVDRMLSGLFWGVGIHYENLTSAFRSPIVAIFQEENAAAAAAGAKILPHILTNNIHCWCTKWGYMWPLVIMALKSKAPGLKEIGRTAFVPLIFSISEPTVFGLPVVLNPYLMFGYPTAYFTTCTVTWFMFKANLCRREFITVPWCMPSTLQGYLATGGDWRAFILMAVNFVVGYITWLPFFKAYENHLIKEAEKKEFAEA